MITKDDLLSVLRDQLPEFQVNSEWVAEGLGYPIINDLARYICFEAGVYGHIEVKKAIALLDNLQKQGDSYIRDLVYECLESLVSCKAYPVISEYLTAGLAVISQTIGRQSH